MSVQNLPTTATDAEEPLLKPATKRFVVHPIEHPDLWKMYKTAQSLQWKAEEIHLDDDVACWDDKLTVDERRYLAHVLAFFAASDGIVNENLCVHFMREVQYAEARSFYGEQIAIENVHAEMYSILLTTFIRDPVALDHYRTSLETIPAIASKAQWALKWMGSGLPFAYRIVAFACVEGIFFSGSFCSIFWLKKRGLMPGLCSSNELISRDEKLHCDFACLLYTKLEHQLPHSVILDIVLSAVACEEKFVAEALCVDLIGMNSQLMIQYIHYTADRLLDAVSVPSYYNVENPFDFMIFQTLTRKTNFFELSVTEYQKNPSQALLDFEMDV